MLHMSSARAGEPGGAEVSETGRLEAFSDGVLAVIITIMVLELGVPHGASWPDLRAKLPHFLIYILSFVFIGIYWNNHHHLLRAAHRVTASVMWANLHLLFWLSLVPVLTAWVAEFYHNSLPAAAYGGVCVCAALAFTLLTAAIVRADGQDSAVARAIGRDWKGRGSLAAYVVATGLAFASPWIAYVLFAAIAVVWLIPDRRLDRRTGADGELPPV
jgi:uncharacterized membrane protein